MISEYKAFVSMICDPLFFVSMHRANDDPPLIPCMTIITVSVVFTWPWYHSRVPYRYSRIHVYRTNVEPKPHFSRADVKFLSKTSKQALR